MAAIGFFKRIIKEDFPQQYQALIDKLAFPINSALEAIQAAMNKGLTLQDNFNAVVKTFAVVVDAQGIPKSSVSFKNTLNTPLKDLWVTGVANTTNPANYPLGGVFVSFSQSSGQVFVNHVTGLRPNDTYNLRIIALG